MYYLFRNTNWSLTNRLSTCCKSLLNHNLLHIQISISFVLVLANDYIRSHPVQGTITCHRLVKQYATGPSSTILVLTRDSSTKQVKQVIVNIQSPLHGYHHRETINITYASEVQNLLMILYPHDEAKRNSWRLWRDWSPASFCEHLNLVFPVLIFVRTLCTHALYTTSWITICFIHQFPPNTMLHMA